jgi:hypothetical protein
LVQSSQGCSNQINANKLQLKAGLSVAFVTQQQEARLYVGKSAVFYNQPHKYGDFIYRIYGTKMEYNMACWSIVDRNSTVDMATSYGMEGPGIEFRWG